MKVFLTNSQDGRILIQSRVSNENLVGDVLIYLSQGQSFLNVPYEQLVQSTPGQLELPETNIEPQMPDDMQPENNPDQPEQ